MGPLKALNDVLATILGVIHIQGRGELPGQHTPAVPKRRAHSTAAQPHSITIWSLDAGKTHAWGPIPPREEYHYVSRQTCRAYLRGLWFRKTSDDNPLMSRRERRKLARLFAKLEYRETIRPDAVTRADSYEGLSAAAIRSLEDMPAESHGREAIA